MQLTDVEIHLVRHLSLVSSFLCKLNLSLYNNVHITLSPGLFDCNEQPAGGYSAIHHSHTEQFAIIALPSLINNLLSNTTALAPAPAVTSLGYTLVSLFTFYLSKEMPFTSSICKIISQKNCTGNYPSSWSQFPTWPSIPTPQSHNSLRCNNQSYSMTQSLILVGFSGMCVELSGGWGTVCWRVIVFWRTLHWGWRV